MNPVAATHLLESSPSDSGTTPANSILAELKLIRELLERTNECACVDAVGLATLIAVSERTVFKMLAENAAPPSFTVGTRRLWRIGSIRKWIEDQEKQNKRR